MRKLILVLTGILILNLNSCESEEYSCGSHNGYELFKGPQGGCYYINSNGNKTYVDRNECDC